MSHLPLLEVTHDLVKFSPAVVSHLVQEEDSQVNIIGKVARNGNIAAIAKGANLDIINLASNERLAAWSFCSSSQEPETEITCLVPFSSDPSSKNTSHVLVGLDTGLHGLLAVFDVKESRVVRAVALPQRVGSLALVSGCGGPVTPPYFHPALLYFHGIVAVGMMEGRTLLLDLNMDEAVESSDSSPAGVFFIGAQSRDVARLRRKAIEEGTHMGLEVAIHTQGETFTWDKVTFPSDCVQVTSLHFCPQLASLAVGYNCGVWLLLPLTPPMVPAYTSPYSPGLPPVVGLTWQEPLDDPRHYTYYWVMRGAGDTLAMASLYSLTFKSRQWDMVEGPCYENLESVALRFEHELGGDPAHGGAEVSRVVSVDTLELALGTGGSQDRSGGSDIEQVKDMGLLVIVWECDKAVTYMGVFDINCWYQAQMPGSVPEGGGLCSYLSLCEVGGGGVIDVNIDVDSIAKFGPTSLVEQHFYPSSLKFNLMVVSGEGALMAIHLGLQRKVLAELSRPSSLVQPSELYQFCLLSGLATGPQLEPSLLTQRKALLTVALEQSMVGVVVAAVRDWADGRYSKAGCSLKFLLDWAWNRVIYIKEMIDSQTVPLFDHSLSEVDVGARGTLVSLAGQLAQLVTVLSSLASMSGIITEIGQDQLECRLNVTGLVLLYTQAISWFVNVGLLPEQLEGPGNPFPVSKLEKQYNDKRKRLAGLQGPFGRPGLMVDILCEDIGDDLICSFQKAGGTGSYPPPSLHSLISTFLSESPAPAKLRLVQYFFLDLAHLLPPDQFPDLVDNLIKFPSAFSLPPSVIKLTQAFWLLDHEDWEEAVSMMLDPLLQEDDLTPTHHRAILISLLAQSQPTLALKYTRIRRPPCMLPQDVSLHTSVLLANGAIQEAFTFQRSRRGSANSSNILAQFYRRAEELGKLDAVLQLSLTTNEEKEFVIFLQSSKRVDSQEVLLMYYLQRSRFTEAMQLNLSLKTLGKGGSSAREAIMERYNHILPGLATTLGTRRVTLTSAHGMGTRPVPLSVTLQDRNIRLNSHASAIEARLSTPVNSRKENQFTPFRARGRRGENREIVRPTDITQNYKRKADEEPTICYPNETFQDHSLLSSTKVNGTNLVSPPRKRTRLSDVSTLNMSVKSMRRMSRYMTAEAITILSTPTITKVRKVAPSFREDPNIAPASILKVKQLIKEASPVVEGDKILDVSLSLDKTPAMGSRDTTPTKSLRFREPTKFPSDLASKPAIVRVPSPPPPKADADDSDLSNDTNDSFHSFNNSGQMEVDSPVRPPVDSQVNFKIVVDSPLASKSFGGRPSIGTLSREGVPSLLAGGVDKVSSSSSSHTVSVTVTEDGKSVREETTRVQSGITITSVSPTTKAKLEEVLKKAESKLKEKEQSVLLADEAEVQDEESGERKEFAGLLGAKDLVLHLEGEDSQDSDIFMHGKSWERSVDTSEDIKKEASETVDADTKDNDDADEEYESEDDKYYDNKVFERKECDIVLEASEDSKDSDVGADREKVSDESKDSDTQQVTCQRRSESEKTKEVMTVDDENSKDCEVVVDTSEDDADNNASREVEELDESDESDAEVKDLNYSWAPQGNLDKYERQNHIADEIKKLVAEETIKSSVEVIDDGEESVVIEDEEELDDVLEDVAVEDVEPIEGLQGVEDEKSKISTIDLDESAEDKAAPQLNFSSDNDDSMEVNDEVIEIDSDEEQEVEGEPESKVAFSSLFSQSSHESEGELEVSNVEEPVEKESEPSEASGPVAEELVIVEDSSNSTELPTEAGKPAAETGSMIFSTFGKKEERSSEELSSSVEEVQCEDKKVEKNNKQVKKIKDDIDELIEDSEESENEQFEEEPVFFEEEPFDLEADFFSPGATVSKAPLSRSNSATYSYDVCTSEVDMDRKPTERKEEIEHASEIKEADPMDLVRQIISEAEKEKESAPDDDVVTEQSLAQEDTLVLKDKWDKSVHVETEHYDHIELRNRTVTETLSLISEFGQERESTEAPEDDDMRELLDHVSTTATRASSIAGSIFGEPRAGSVSGSVFGDAPSGYGPTFRFSEPGQLDQSELNQEAEEESRLNFNFSMPLDSSQLENEENTPSREFRQSKLAFDYKPEVYDKLELRNRTVTETFSLLSNIGQSSSAQSIASAEIPPDQSEEEDVNESKDGSDDENEDEEAEDESGEEDGDEESKDDSSEDSEEDDQVGGLEFSWTKIPSQKPTNISQIISEEIQTETSDILNIRKAPESPFLFGKPQSGYLRELEKDAGSDRSAQLLFSEPLVESENQIVDLNDSQFDFGEPNDESMDMDTENHEVTKVHGIAKLDKPTQALSTPIKASKSVTPSRRSTRKASRDDVLTKSETLPHELTPLKLVKSSRKTPAKNTPKRTQAKVAVLEYDSDDADEKSQSVSNVETPGRSKRGGSVKSSSVDNSKSPKAPSLASTEPLESDSEERAAQFTAEEVLLAPPSSTKKRGRPRKEVSTPVVEKSRSDSTQSKVSMMDISTKSSASSKASTVPMSTNVSESTSSDASTKLKKTAITSEMDDLALASKTTPATPIRRSRRISGVTPSMTPTMERSRRTSGASVGEIKPLVLGGKYDQLELRNRTVTETLSLVSDLGQEEENKDSQREEFDSLELRNRTVTETLSLTDNFGNKDIKKTATAEASTSIAMRKSRRRSSNLTPEGSPVPSPASTKPSPKGAKSSPITASMSVSPKENLKRSTRRAAKTTTSPTSETPVTPVKASALPKHLTPLKKVLTPKKEEGPLTPTRRSRRLSSGDIGSGEPLTPSRRSRRLSGSTTESLDSAPDGGLITGGTPRKTPSTPRSRRHTSVRPEDVESALAIAGAAPLPTLVEEEEREESVEKEEEREEIIPVMKRGRKAVAKPSDPSLNIISEEDTARAEMDGLPDISAADGTIFFPMKSRPKRKDTDQLTPEAPPKRKRRVTIITLGTDVDLFGVAETSSSSRRESTGGAALSKKKYVPVKKKTSVRIK